MLSASVRLINDSKKGPSCHWKDNVEIKNSAQNDRHQPWRTLRYATPWYDDAQQLQWRRDPAYSQLSSYAVFHVVKISHACFVHLVLQYFPTHFSQLNLNPANLEATIEAEWILAFLFLRKRHFSMTSQLRHHYRVSCNYWWNILQFFTHTNYKDDSCQKNLSEFVKVTAKILSVPFSRKRCIISPRKRRTTSTCSSPVAERPRDASCLTEVVFNRTIPRAHL